jgi:hypothetical protein
VVVIEGQICGPGGVPGRAQGRRIDLVAGGLVTALASYRWQCCSGRSLCLAVALVVVAFGVVGYATTVVDGTGSGFMWALVEARILPRPSPVVSASSCSLALRSFVCCQVCRCHPVLWVGAVLGGGVGLVAPSSPGDLVQRL